MTWTVKCAICGKEFEAKAKNGKYCSKECKYKAAWLQQKEYKALQEEHDRRRLEEVVIERRTRKPRCKGCVWRSWVDHHKCVMPTCLAGLGAVHDRG